MKQFLPAVVILAILFQSCEPEVIPIAGTGGKIVLEFVHQVKGNPLITDTMCYVNEAGNPYEVNELKYFISDVFLRRNDGSRARIEAETAIHYVDIDIPATLTWNVYDTIPEGTYDSISFIFGLIENRNVSFAFVNPPEVNMFWPDILGGGYHYLMLNGKWKDPQDLVSPFDMHLGIGQLYSGTTTSVDSITGYVQNYFTVTLPLPDLSIRQNSLSTIQLEMDIDSWFSTPHTWDFNEWGGYIMQNQPAMQVVRENGQDAFSIGNLTQLR